MKINADGTLPWKRDELGHPYLEPEVETAIVSAGGPHDHDATYAPVAHAHGGGAEHPDLAAHEALGLAAEHAHDYAASGHGHDTSHDHNAQYAGTAHNHDGSYAAPHGHPYAADAHVHADPVHDHDGVYEPVHAHPYAASGHNHDAAYSGTAHTHNLTEPDIPAAIARDAEVTAAIATHAATPHGGEGGGPVYDVGDLYLTTTNHADAAAVATHFGYGTWQRFGVGRFLLLTDGTAGQTGGSATHAHTFTQPSDHAALTHAGTAVAAHNVTQPAAHTEVINHTHTTDSQGAHVHDEFRNSATTGGLDGWAAGDTSTNTPTLTGYDTGSAGAHTHTAQNPAGGVASIAHTGTAVDAHSVTQPSQHAAQSHSGGAVADGNTDPLSITAYAWLRTA